MKHTCASAIVVEGQSDIQFLTTFVEAEFIATNGSDVPRETIEYLQSLSKIKPIIVLTDPDGPGTRIRHLLDGEIPNLYHAFIPKQGSIKKNKVGVAESTKTLILKALELPIFTATITTGKLTMNDILTLGLTGGINATVRRRMVEAAFRLGYNNAKQLLFRLNNLNINYKQVSEVLRQHE